MWYKKLGVDKNASLDEIENAYKNKLNDPQISKDLNKMNDVCNAYNKGKNEINKSNEKNSKSNNFKLYIVSICVLALLLSTIYLFVRTITYKNPNNELSSTFTFQECLAFNGNRGYYSREDVKKYISEDLTAHKYFTDYDIDTGEEDFDYVDFGDEDTEYEGFKVLGDKVLVFGVKYNENKTECTISINESFVDDGIYIERKVYTDGFEIGTYISEYRFRNNKGMNIIVKQFIYDSDTIDNYKLVEKESYENTILYKYFDEQKDLKFKDELINEINKLK